MDYAIIRVGNKQHRVRDGETLVVDRVHTDEGKTFAPDVLLGDAKVTVKVLAHERGPKIRIGKYRKRTGYKRHTGFRAATTRIEVSLGGRQPRPRPPRRRLRQRRRSRQPDRRSGEAEAGREARRVEAAEAARRRAFRRATRS